MRHVVGVSGGKDSVALALRLREVEPDTEWEYIITPTGGELPPMDAHWNRLEVLLGKPLLRITNPKATTLDALIEIQQAIPNFRQRWCTRMLKIEPTIAWCVANAPVLMHVGLRADEDEREGIYGPYVTSRYPFREWGWGIKEVWAYLAERGVEIPERTDCGECYHQKLSEWWNLWELWPDRFWKASRQEQRFGHTFRSPKRDTWPVWLHDLANEFQRLQLLGARSFFEANNIRRIERGLPPLKKDPSKKNGQLCRVCSL